MNTGEIARLNAAMAYKSSVAKEFGLPMCHICGDEPAFLVEWRNSSKPEGYLCDDCIEIQQWMYGNTTNDVISKVE